MILIWTWWAHPSNISEQKRRVLVREANEQISKRSCGFAREKNKIACFGVWYLVFARSQIKDTKNLNCIFLPLAQYVNPNPGHHPESLIMTGNKA